MLVHTRHQTSGQDLGKRQYSIDALALLSADLAQTKQPFKITWVSYNTIKVDKPCIDVVYVAMPSKSNATAAPPANGSAMIDVPSG